MANIASPPNPRMNIPFFKESDLKTAAQRIV
jgi:hypothetical protein